MKKSIVILGSSGSIGRQTLEVIAHHSSEFAVKGLVAGSNIEVLQEQILEFNPKMVAVFDKEKAKELSKKVSCKVLGGMEGILELIHELKADLCMCAMTGSCGLTPCFEALKAGSDILLANKEVLVCAGSLFMELASKLGKNVIPVDSEHMAIFQCLQGRKKEEVARLILTASGGPFFKRKESLETITKKEALSHPTWKMGSKITIDSSTMMNKGLEVIEAHWLFNIPIDKIDVVVHPQSIIHSFVEFIDGHMLAQLAENKMIIPIQYALSFPKRWPGMVPPFDFRKHANWEFYEPDHKRFPCLSLAYQALKTGGTMPCFMNGANEILVERFLAGELRWIDIGQKLEKLMGQYSPSKETCLAQVIEVDLLARELARRF